MEAERVLPDKSARRMSQWRLSDQSLEWSPLVFNWWQNSSMVLLVTSAGLELSGESLLIHAPAGGCSC